MNIATLISGGVDSSVVVHLLCEQGYKPDLFYIKIGMDRDTDLSCSAEEDIEISTLIARKYGLKLEVIDLQKEYWEKVVAYTIDRVKRGLTPNPDVMCNKLIKFGCFEERAGKEYDKTATGHYATTRLIDNKIWLGTAKDTVKDQTDFLAQIDALQVAKHPSKCPEKRQSGHLLSRKNQLQRFHSSFPWRKRRQSGGTGDRQNNRDSQGILVSYHRPT